MSHYNETMVFICDQPYSGTDDFSQFPFPLSDFQKYAIDGIKRGEHVLVTAHTGSGKTLPAEFAIQYFVALGKKVIYTSPIKALSNQKFYEFSKKYPHISFGLLTGDIKTNPTADVLIMTTEILMNALFSKQTQQSDLSFQMDVENDVGCVIFDEVHYINDAHRGQTWEQTILMLPLHIQMVMLSATIDNPVGFAEWIEQRSEHQTQEHQTQNKNKKQTQNKQVYLASTEHRVVPLTHYGFFATTETPFKTTKDKVLQEQIRKATNRLIPLYLPSFKTPSIPSGMERALMSGEGIADFASCMRNGVKQPSGKFEDTGYTTLLNMNSIFNKYDWRMKRKFVLNKLAEHLKEKDMLPAIVFVFSRKAVEQCAKEITTNLLEDDSKVPYTIRNECEQIVRKFSNYKEYLELPEYIELVDLLEKGVGIHHSGMIPVLREIVELMIGKKCIKILFATESFAIGLDCPIKTAVFSALKKFDGTQNRYLLPHEYTQMAGRAGRRGIDTVGHIVHCNNLFELPSLLEYKDILCGKPQKLVSKFKLSYPLVLNLLRYQTESGEKPSFESFVQKTMLNKELEKAILATEQEIHQQVILYDKQMEVVSRTPLHICEEYWEIEEMRSMYSGKKQKEIQRKIQAWKDENRFFSQDVENIKIQKGYKKAIEKNEKEIEYLKGYAAFHIGNICELFEKNGFIQGDKFSEHGLIASLIHEIHPLIGADLIRHTPFMTYSAKHIATILSIFTDISISDDIRALNPPSSLEPDLKHTVDILKIQDTLYAREELERGLYSPDVKFTFDIMDIIGEWCEATTEQECKFFLQTKLVEREISLGDFTKAVLKIVVIVKEFQAIAETFCNLSFLSALKEVEPLLLKFVATNQSLYV